MKSIHYLIVFVAVFFVGGALQLTGWISYTGTTLLISIIIFLIAALIIYRDRRINVLVFSSTILLLLTILLSALYNHSSIINVIVYTFQAILFVSTYLFIAKASNKTTNKLMDLLFLICLVQLPVIIIQRQIYPYIANHVLTNLNIRDEDFSFGTFFLAEDHALGFLIFSFFLLIVTNKFKPKFFSKYIILPYFILTIVLLNSKITILLLLSFGAYYLIRKSPIMSVSIILLIMVLAFVFKNQAIFNNTLSKVKFASEYYDRVYSDSQILELIDDKSAGRLELISYYSMQSIPWIGEGPGAYKDYTTGYIFNNNFGQVLWYYKALGLAGVFCSTFMMYVVLGRQKNSFSIVYFGILIIYSLFANIFLSLAFLLTYFIVLRTIDEQPT